MDFKFLIFWISIVIILLIPEPVKTIILCSVTFFFIFNALRNRIQLILK